MEKETEKTSKKLKEEFLYRGKVTKRKVTKKEEGNND